MPVNIRLKVMKYYEVILVGLEIFHKMTVQLDASFSSAGIAYQQGAGIPDTQSLCRRASSS
jgi:hypothetical protein